VHRELERLARRNASGRSTAASSAGSATCPAVGPRQLPSTQANETGPPYVGRMLLSRRGIVAARERSSRKKNL
jgi:hypothetical protein